MKSTGTATADEPGSGLPSQHSRRSVLRTAAVAAAALGASSVSIPTASAAAPVCSAQQPGGPVVVTPDCDDPLYNQPVIDSEQDLTSPVPHHRISGHFEGTYAKFTFYLPPKARWDGRFFQLVYPLQTENATDDDIAFALDSGGYRVQTNGRTGFRVDAAAAKFSKQVAARYYGTRRRIHGYLYGGSGGSYQTFGAMENTTGIWDGAVPFIPGAPTSVPNNFFLRAFARLVLGPKAPRIADAMRPGGSGDPYPCLSDVERSVLLEVTKMGIPLRAWANYSYVLGLNDPQGLLGFEGTVRSLDPTYADDFWSKRGYLGTERSPLGALIRAARIDHAATVKKVSRDAQNQPTSLDLDDVPPNPANLSLDFTAYQHDGTTKIGTLTGTLDEGTRVFTLGSGNPPEVVNALAEGVELRMDNRWSLALVTYHRHQVPTRPGFYAWDQFCDAKGRPIPPQRGIQVGPQISANTSGGGTDTGKITGKMITVVNLLDTDAFPWQGDWYTTQVKQALGARYDDMYRVWFNDNADHIGAHLPGLVDYSGILQQALRDLSAWVERGVAPSPSTRYAVVSSQVRVPANALQRRGIQPVVDLSAGAGGTRIDVRAGRPVTFGALIQVPPRAGQVVSTEWDFTGDGTFTALPFGPPRPGVKVSTTHTYSTPGTYIATLRVTANRDGDPDTQFAKVQNLGQIRVVVH
ncbi:PKD domain-containing protein [Streptomyces sviceus]|uniref:PKD domain-containing protein n=1 Tax=Streptomyces sviceus TaxID=285530 RepID=UPI003688429A